MGLQLLLPVPQAEVPGAPLGCITSARELGTRSGLSQANTVPSAQDPGGANALLETRATLEWMADGKVKAQKEETLLSPRPERNWPGMCTLAGEGFAVCGVSAAPEGLWWMSS